MKKKVKSEKNDTWVSCKNKKLILSSKFKIEGKKYVVELEYSEDEFKNLIAKMVEVKLAYEKDKLRFEM